MAKDKKIARLETPPPGARGRTAKTRSTALPHEEENNSKGKLKLEKVIDVNRTTGKPSKRGGSNRGDRRDMSPTYTGNARHAARGNTPRRDVKTRAR